MVAAQLTHQGLEGEAEQAVAQGVGVPTGGPQRLVGVAEVGGNGGGTEPGSNGASSLGEEGAAQQLEQAWGRASVECGAKVVETGGHEGGQLRQ
jgi:hypothetical protein